MTADEAKELAKRIINSWHGGPNLTEWVDALTPLEAGPAGTAFIRLRNELEHAPKIATFMAKYRGLVTSTTAPMFARHICDRCNGTGWITHNVIVVATPDTAPTDGQASKEYSSVRPCTSCHHGRHAETIAALIHVQEAQHG